ncbi:uncharacterized protein LOC114727954 [Neltuma alba]|uniref:uncharacterized protein LOC114727954 n=1 Tax=Neltuma alba TaxID=207710 RepID=UPI0010A2E80D|nr:uncharacterized protein LOC114727954 [Prosopis alba]
MASTAMPEQISLRVVVDKEQNRVLYAEAGKDFVDILLSFLTLPLGTIARLVSRDSNMKPCRFGCISSLYESVGNLDPKYLNSETCKQMLLQPRNSMERYNQNLKLNIDDTKPTKYYACGDCLIGEVGSLVSTSKNMKCKCGRDFTHLLIPCKSLLCSPQLSGSDKNASGDAGDLVQNADNTWEGYVKETASFIISDDLSVTPANFNTTLCLLKNLRSECPPEESTMVLSSNKILDLLKSLLISKTALTDSLLRKEHNLVHSETSFKMTDERQGRESIGTTKIKVLMSKSKSKILFAEVEEDFVDQLFSFLTFPIGAVERVLEGNSGLVCVNNLYNSLSNFDSTRHLKSEKMNNMFASLKVAPYFKANNQMLPIDEMNYPSKLSCWGHGAHYLTAGAKFYRFYIDHDVKREVRMCDPKSTIAEEKSGKGYAKGGTTFMVADDLSVKPLSSHDVLSSLLTEFKVPYHELEQRTICIGVQEVLSILKASMVSTSALTIGLKEFLSNNIKEEDETMTESGNITVG